MARSYDMAAPAKLFFWPAENGSEEEAVYATLTDAVAAALEGDASAAWIITQAGDILNPRIVAQLKEESAPARRRERREGLFSFGWARAA